MKQVKVGQTWISKFGTKNSKTTILIQEQLNAKCWRVYEDPQENSRMMSSDDIYDDFVLENK
jgi:hypothetical protein